MSVRIESVDRKTITVEFPASPSELANALSGAAEDGYAVTGAAEITDGNQRDPVTKGVKLTLTRHDRA